MNESEIISVVREYLEDKKSSYALMMTGEWGSGKTYFVEHELTEALEAEEGKHPVIVASAYGVKNVAELCGAIEASFISKCAAIERADNAEKDKKESLIDFAKEMRVAFFGKKLKDLKEEVGIDLNVAPLNTAFLIIGSETLLVIDDLERCGMDLQELFGAIDHLVVNFKKKVLLVCNEEKLRKQLDDDNKEKYDQLVEKTVWRKCQFEPTIDTVMEQVLGDELREIYPEAIEDAVSAIRESGSLNFRSLNKMRPMLVGIKESGFFAEISDKELARKIFKEVCGFAAMAAKGEHIDSSPKQMSAYHMSRRKKYDALDFIARFFKRYDTIDPEHIRNCLDSYFTDFYINELAAQKARECIGKIRSWNFRDNELPGLVKAIAAEVAPADGRRGIPLDIYFEALDVINNRVEEFADVLPEGTTPLIEAMKSSIRQDSESMESIESTVRDFIADENEWSTASTSRISGDTSAYLDKTLKEMGELTKYAFDQLYQKKEDFFSNVMENNPSQFVSEFSLMFDDPRSMHQPLDPVRLLISLKPTLFARAIQRMDSQEIRNVTHVLSAKDLLESEEDKTALSSWAGKLKLEVDKLNPRECYQKKYFKVISNDLDELITKLEDVAACPEEQPANDQP